MGVSVLSKVTSVSLEASLPLSRSKEETGVSFLIDGMCTSVALVKMSGPSTDVTVTPLPHALSLVCLTPFPFRTNKCISVE